MGVQHYKLIKGKDLEGVCTVRDGSVCFIGHYHI